MSRSFLYCGRSDSRKHACRILRCTPAQGMPIKNHPDSGWNNTAERDGQKIISLVLLDQPFLIPDFQNVFCVFLFQNIPERETEQNHAEHKVEVTSEVRIRGDDSSA